jgi:hypothetical protein
VAAFAGHGHEQHRQAGSAGRQALVASDLGAHGAQELPRPRRCRAVLAGRDLGHGSRSGARPAVNSAAAFRPLKELK